MKRGFSNWKDGTISFKKHERSACHCEAVDVVVTIPSTTQDVGMQLSARQKEKKRQALYQIIISIKFLGRQGLPLRGDKGGLDSNLHQLLKMKAETDLNLGEWLKRKQNVYTSPDIHIEIDGSTNFA